jgi:hypothetical protein
LLSRLELDFLSKAIETVESKEEFNKVQEILNLLSELKGEIAKANGDISYNQFLQILKNSNFIEII